MSTIISPPPHTIKRILAVIFTAAMALGLLAGCGSNSPASHPASPPATISAPAAPLTATWNPGDSGNTAGYRIVLPGNANTNICNSAAVTAAIQESGTAPSGVYMVFITNAAHPNTPTICMRMQG
jgi:hypothetical protein